MFPILSILAYITGLGYRQCPTCEYAVPRRLFSDPKMLDLEWPLNVTHGVLRWLWRQIRPRRQG